MSVEAINAILKHHEEVVEKLNKIISLREQELAQVSAHLADARVLLMKRGITDATAGTPKELIGSRTKSEAKR
jgi:hypothetical protein